MIDDKKVSDIQDKIRKALAQIEKDENVKISFNACRYNAAQYTTQMAVKSLDKDEAVDKIFLSMCKRIGFTQNILGMKFEGPNGIYEIVDIKLKNFKYPVIAKTPSGKQYKYSVDHIKKLIGGDKIINRNANLDKLIG